MPDSDNTFDPRKIRELRNVKINMGGLKITNLGDATADTDALNRQSGDARYQSGDETVPNAPGAWSASDAGTYIDARGQERGAVDITWTDPTLNTDASACTDLEEIMVCYKRAAATNFTQIPVKPGVQAATVDKLFVGVQYEFKAFCHDIYGHNSAFTASEFETPGGDATAPSQPSAPTGVGSSSRGINVIHDLQKAAGGNLQDDLSYLLVYFDTDSTIPTAAANLGGEIPATYTEITAGDGVNRTFTKYGTTELVRGSTYYCKVVPVDQAGNKGTASAASAAIVAGAEAGSTAVPPTPTVSARLGGVVAAFNLADGTPDYGPSNLDVTSFKLFGGWATAPTTAVGWLPITRGQLSNSMIVWKKIDLPVGTVGTYYVRAQSLNSLGTLSDYGVEGSGLVVALGQYDIEAHAIKADHLDVTILSAITASMGALTVDGTLTLAAGGMIKGTNLEIDSDGDMTATNVDLTGKITASSGSLSGLSISGTLTLSGTGELITAASGQRVVVSGAAGTKDRVLFYTGSGDGGEQPGAVYSMTADPPRLYLQSPYDTAAPTVATVNLAAGATQALVVIGGDLIPLVGGLDVGTSTNPWTAVVSYIVCDEAGTTRLDLNGNWTCAGTITSGGTAVSLAGHDHAYATGLMADVGAGSAAAPAIYLNGDSNTGLYQPAADQIGLATAGAAKLEILHTGANPVWIYCASGLRRIIRSADQDGAGNYLLAVQDT